MIIGSKIRHYINGKDFGEPRNWQELTIVKDWLNNSENVDINITDLEFVLEANKYLQERVLNGLNGGVGIFEGEPYQIKIGEETNPVYTFDGYLDFTEETTLIGLEEISVSLKKYEGSDWLNDVADGFSFAYLYEQGVITSSDFVEVPYVINYVPDNMQLIVLSMSLYMMTKELIENIQKLAETVGDVTNAATPVIGVGVGWDLGDFILIAIKAVARIAYIIAIVIAIKELIEQIFEQLLPEKKYHLGMTFRDMLIRGCDYLGLSFSSSITELDWVHIPIKDKEGGSDDEVGYPSNTGPIYTFGDLIRQMKKMFNAEHVISNGVLRLERKDSFEETSSYVIPSYFSDQERLLNVNSFNTDEMIANYNINWNYDTQDQNTLDNQEGRVFQAITTPITISDEKLVNIKNLSEVNLPFSLGRTKTSLTEVEKLAKTLGSFVDSLTGIFGGGTNYKNQIKDRIGSLLLSSHFLTYGKVVKMSGSKLSTEQREELSASNLWFNYHFINSFSEINGVHNQFWRFKEFEVPMSLEDFSKLLENNKVTDYDGNECYIERMEYEPQNGKALIDYRVRKKYTNNLKIQYV